MSWPQQLGKESRGSRPRCVLLTDGGTEEVASRLTGLVGLGDVWVGPSDRWMPRGRPQQMEDGSWDTAPADEAELDKPTNLLPHPVSERLKEWWLANSENSPRTPSLDIASTCTIGGRRGLLLIEAKAHWNELNRSSSGKRLKGTASRDVIENHERIGQAILQAAVGLQTATGGAWNISRDSHYQLSNRFAWSWKLATLGIPVVLLFLGFLNATDIAKGGNLFFSQSHWERVLQAHCEGVIDSSCWEKRLDVDGATLLPLIRAYYQPFQPCES